MQAGIHNQMHDAAEKNRSAACGPSIANPAMVKDKINRRLMLVSCLRCLIDMSITPSLIQKTVGLRLTYSSYRINCANCEIF